MISHQKEPLYVKTVKWVVTVERVACGWSYRWHPPSMQPWMPSWMRPQRRSQCALKKPYRKMTLLCWNVHLRYEFFACIISTAGIQLRLCTRPRLHTGSFFPSLALSLSDFKGTNNKLVNWSKYWGTSESFLFLSLLVIDTCEHAISSFYWIVSP